MSLFAEASLNQFTFFAEHLAALEGYAAATNSEPSATQFEVAFEAGEFTYAASYQETDEAEFLQFPEERISVGLSREILGGLGLGIEFAKAEAYKGDKTNSLVIQIAAEF